ncbi:MAG: hypothetical protein ACTSYZ_08175 [Candidatus Helarchaeota archaeon]
MDWILNFYKISAKLTLLNRFCKKFYSEELNKAVNYYNYDKRAVIDLHSDDIIKSAILSFIISFFSFFFILSLINFYFSILISLIFSLIISKKIYGYLIIQFHIQQDNFLQYLDLIYQDFILILKSSGTLLDCIKYVSKSDYPIISGYFKEIVKKINMGQTPEHLLIEFAGIIANPTFKENFLSLLSSDIHNNDLINKNPKFSVELLSKYQKTTEQLQVRFTILITINIFLPIITIVLFSIYLASNPWFILILIPFHLFILIILKKSLIKRSFVFFGESVNQEKELILLLNFLDVFSNYLCLNNSPEIALFKSIKLLKLNSSFFKNPEMFIQINNFEFNEYWNNLINNFKEQKNKILLKLILKMLSKNSLETGKRIKNILDNIEFNRKLIAKRKTIIKSIQFKVLILMSIFSILMGLFTNILPIFSLFFQQVTNGLFIQNNFILFDNKIIIPIIITNTILVFFTSKIIFKTINFQKSLPISLLFILIYFISFYFTSFFLINGLNF